MVLRFNRGEEFIATLKDFCRKEKIQGGWFFGLGAISKVELAFYNLTEKKYYDRIITEALEVISLMGNIAVMDKGTIIHVHGVFSNKQMKTIAGHINKLVVAATLEVYLTKLPKIEREYSEKIGLNLMKR